jgi:hypothetical protein
LESLSIAGKTILRELKKAGINRVDWINMAGGTGNLRSLVNVVMNVPVP